MLSIKSAAETKIGQGKLAAYRIFSSEMVCVTSVISSHVLQPGKELKLTNIFTVAQSHLEPSSATH